MATNAYPPSARVAAFTPLSLADQAFQRQALAGVSRTFALTIPQLPARLRDAVGTLYLLCRVADTIEDVPNVDLREKQRLADALIDSLEGRGAAHVLAADLGAHLAAMSSAECALIRELPRLLELVQRYSEAEGAIFVRTLRVMVPGMLEFQRVASPAGLADTRELDAYCYVVAGVVGEALTELLCLYDGRLARERERLLCLGRSFGQGLQLTNILKDQWEDRARGVCWLPRDLFAGIVLVDLDAEALPPQYHVGVHLLVARAHACLRDAMEYTLSIPAADGGVRRFCLWSLGMALLTLAKIDGAPQAAAAARIKISRRSVRAVMATTTLVARYDGLLRHLFAWAGRGLPPPPRASAAQIEIIDTKGESRARVPW